MTRKKIIISLVATAAVAISGFLLVKGFLHTEQPDVDPVPGRAQLTALATQDFEAIQGTINAIEEEKREAIRAQMEAEAAEAAAQLQAAVEAQQIAEEEAKAIAFQQWCDEANAMADADQFKGIFADSVVMGDSIVNGILETDMLLETSVVAKVGADMVDMLDYVPRVQALYPSRIFIYLGFNDVSHCYGSYDAFVQRYHNLLDSLMAACPGVPIYLNYIIPLLNLETETNPLYLDVDSYNALIDQVAADYGCVVVNELDLVREEFYYKDGYHMIRPFYPLWMRRMAEVSGLM